MLLRLLLIACIVPFSFNELSTEKDSVEADVKELTRLENIWNEAHRRGDIKALDELWADDLFVTVPNMPVMNKADSLGIWKSGKMKFDVYKTSDIRIRVYGDAAVVTGQLERIRDSNSTQFEDDWRFTKVYVRRSGKWRVVAWHGSHVAQ